MKAEHDPLAPLLSERGATPPHESELGRSPFVHPVTLLPNLDTLPISEASLRPEHDTSAAQRLCLWTRASHELLCLPNRSREANIRRQEIRLPQRPYFFPVARSA